MADDMADIIAETLSAGNTGDAPAPEPAVAPAPSPNGNTADAAPEDGPKGPRWEDIRDPVARELAKGFQADHTRKSQEAAELRRQLEEQNARYAGIDEETLSTLSMLKTLQQEDPSLAQNYLRSLADRLGALGGAPPFPAFDPYPQGYDQSPYQTSYSEPYPNADYSGEETLPPAAARRLAQLEAWALSQQQREASRQQEEANRRFREGMAQIERTIGRAPTQRELFTVGRFLQDPRNQHLGVLDAYLVTHRDSYEQVILQRGRNEAVQTRHQAAAAPQAPALATPAREPQPATDMQGIIAEAVREAYSNSA